MNKPLISVVVPVYNVEEYLHECIRSIVNQTYTNLEIILVDDGSTDHSPDICDEWMKRDPRIKVIHKRNGGASSARNIGIEQAAGEYLGFVDSDDYIHLQMYEQLWMALSKSSTKIASCAFKKVLGKNEKKFSNKRSVFKELDLEESLNGFLLGNINASVCCKLFLKDIFSTIHFPEGETHEDVYIMIPAIALSKGVVHSNKELYYYRDSANSVTHSYWKTDADIVYRHLLQMQEQLNSIGYGNLPSFKVYLVDSAYSVALCLDKNYGRITEIAKENQRKYLAIMRRYWWQTLFSSHMEVKDKLLYSMIVTRILRPVYTILGKELN